MLAPAISLANFAQFHDTTRAKRATMIRNLRDQRFNPEGYRQRDYYFMVRNGIRRTHWATNDIETLREAYTDFSHNARNLKKREDSVEVAEHYIEYWDKEAETLFQVPPQEVEFEGLTLRISADLGMVTKRGDQLALKMWFKKPKPQRAYRQAFQWLSANLRPVGWDSEWQPALWDVRRKTVLSSIKLPRDMHLNLQGDAAAFLAMWRALGPTNEQE